MRPESLKVAQTGSQKGKLDVDESRDKPGPLRMGSEHLPLSVGGGRGEYGLCHQEEGQGVAWKDAWCPLSCT